MSVILPLMQLRRQCSIIALSLRACVLEVSASVLRTIHSPRHTVAKTHLLLPTDLHHSARHSRVEPFYILHYRGSNEIPSQCDSQQLPASASSRP